MAINKQRIAKNTIVLYVRTMLLMFISLYTSRVVLQILGEVDFGVYGIVGSLATVFVFINGAMSSSTQRFLNVGIGENDKNKSKSIFCQSLIIHFFIGILIILLGETIGLWFLNTHMNIPSDRMLSANWVFQITLASCFISILRVPYNASIIAYERMSFFGLISVIEGVSKLFIVYMLMLCDFDKLILYAILGLFVNVIITIIYKLYCNHNFSITKFNLVWDKSIYKSLLSFSGWTILGSLSIVGLNQGLGVVLNVYYGVIVNAAITIANQVYGAAYSLVGNFQTAFIPQTMKSYASKQMDDFKYLLGRTGRYAFLLYFIIAYPLFFECGFLLDIWLEEVPSDTCVFTQLIIICGVFDAISSPLWTTVQAHGNIRNYQIIVSILYLLTLPLCLLLIQFKASAPIAYISRLGMTFIVLFYRILFLKRQLRIDVSDFIKQSVLVPSLIIFFSIFPALLIRLININEFIKVLILFLVGIIICYIIGINNNERKKITKLTLLKIKL